MRAFDYSTVQSADEAATALASGGPSTMLIAGGADLLSLMKSDLIAPARVVDLKPARNLRGITIQPDGAIRIGALTTLTDIERDENLAERLPILRAAVLDAATPQLRNVATVGGNLMQRTRCWYFRGPYTCWQKGGESCFARGGQNKYHAIFDQSPCVSAHPSDLAPALFALDATAIIQSSSGQRAIPLDELLRPPVDARRHESTLGPSELIVAVTIPPQPDGANGVYLKMMDRHAWAYALVSAAAQLAIRDGLVTHARVVLGGVANTPYRLEAVEARITGQPLTAELANTAADLAILGATPLEHNKYKLPLARELTRRAILLAAGMDW
jgi:xanthine dehydrogenase YagS FAD-binding subunit